MYKYSPDRQSKDKQKSNRLDHSNQLVGKLKQEFLIEEKELNRHVKFFNDVKIEYFDNSILSENLDLLFTKKISKIYNNVVFKNNYLNLNTDKIIIDMTTGDLKLEMNKKKEKVKLVTKYEFN